MSTIIPVIFYPTVCPCSYASPSDRENYFCRTGQNVRQASSAVPDILSSCQTFSPANDGQISVVILVSLSDIFMILCVFNPAGQNVRQGLSSLPDISRSLPDMSGMSSIFRDHWSPCVCLSVCLSHSTTLQAIFRVKVIGHMGQGQRSTLKVKVKGQKCDFRSHLTVLHVMFKVKGYGSGSKVTWVKVKGQVG